MSRTLAVLILMLLGCGLAYAEVVTLRHYRLGDDEGIPRPGDAMVLAIDKVDPVGNLSTESYPLFATSSFLVDSTWAAHLDGVTQYWLNNEPAALPADNFGIELWVKADRVSEDFSIVAYCGDTRFDGWGIYQLGMEWGVSYGGLGRFGSVPVALGQWTHLALVRNNGHSTLYQNGAIVAESDLGIVLPYSGGFALGSHPQLPAGEFFQGGLDEVRVFGFEPGSFRVRDLRLPPRIATLNAEQVETDRATCVSRIWNPVEPGIAWIEWGLTTNYTERSEGVVEEASSEEKTVRFGLKGLSQNTLYHYRSVISNAWGVVYGTNLTFVTDLIVNNLSSDGEGSLRWALERAKPGVEILLQPTGVIPLVGAGLLISNSVTITGGDPTLHVIDGGGEVRPFKILSGASVRIVGLTIQNGRAPDGACGVTNQVDGLPGENGGGIWNQGRLTLVRCVVRDNVAGRGGDGYSDNRAGKGGDGGHGGGIFTEMGQLVRLEECLVYRNRSGAGGNGGTTTSFFEAGAGGAGGDGGGIWSQSICTLVNTSLIENDAGDGGQAGDGFWQFGYAGTGGSGGRGGGLATWSVSIALQSTFSGNGAGEGGPTGFGLAGNGGLHGNGGALMGMISGAQISLVSSTVVSNHAFGIESCGGLAGLGVIRIQSTVLAGNRNDATTGGADVQAVMDSGGNNFVGALEPNHGWWALAQETDVLGKLGAPLDPQVGALDRYTETLWVHFPNVGSPLIGAGRLMNGSEDRFQARALRLDVTRDQVGEKRVGEGAPDVGSVQARGL